MIAEGAETEEHVNEAAAHGVSKVQGWYFERALALDKLLEALPVKGGRVLHEDGLGADDARRGSSIFSIVRIRSRRRRTLRPGLRNSPLSGLFSRLACRCSI